MRPDPSRGESLRKTVLSFRGLVRRGTDVAILHNRRVGDDTNV